MVSAALVKEQWELVVDSKRKDLASRIPSKWIVASIPAAKEQRNIVKFLDKYLSSEEIAITETTATELVSAIAKGALTALQVTTAFCHRAALAHQFVCRLIDGVNPRSTVAMRSFLTSP
jgi:amidase